jgi:hypothetical protein
MLYVPYESRAKLPPKPGIYYVYVDSRLVYIGQSKSLWQRWNATGDREHHHTKKCLASLAQRRKVSIVFRLLPMTSLDVVEKKEIQRHNPPWNKVFCTRENTHTTKKTSDANEGYGRRKAGLSRTPRKKNDGLKNSQTNKWRKTANEQANIRTNLQSQSCRIICGYQRTNGGRLSGQTANLVVNHHEKNHNIHSNPRPIPPPARNC